MKTVICPGCGKRHEVDAKTFDQFGPDCECMNCIEREHLRFMRTTGRKLKLTCVSGCACGMGEA